MTPHLPEQATSPAERGSHGLDLRRLVSRRLLVSIAINAVAPFMIYTALRRYTTLPELLALAATGLPPLLDALVGIVRRRRVDFMAGLVLCTIGLSLALVVLGGDPRLYLVRESLVSAGVALAFLVSLLFRKPLGYYFARFFMSGNDPARMAWVDQLWEEAALFRTVVRVNTLVWGVGLLLEAVLRTYLVYTLTVAQFLVVSPFVFWGCWGVLMLFSFGYGGYARWAGRRATRRGLRRRAAARARPAAPRHRP
jgi:hypothetical protein